MILRSWFVRLVCLAAALLIAEQPAHAEKRAFLVAVENYKAGLPALKTPKKDAAAIGKALSELGFTIDLVVDSERAEFDRRWLAFRGTLKENDVAVFYFGGHGIQVDGANYLLPADFSLTSQEADTLNRAINFHRVMEELEGHRLRATLYVLDACRTNPFVQPGSPKARSTLGQTRGLAPMESVFGAFVMYSAGPNEEALDAAPDNPDQSLFASRLIPRLASPRLSLVDLVKDVQTDVEGAARSVGHQQRPAYFDGIGGHYYLAQLDGDGLSPAGEIQPTGRNVIRLGGFASWDGDCRARPAPRIKVTSPPRSGRILLRFETVTVGGSHFGKTCEKSLMRGIGVYFAASDLNPDNARPESVGFTVQHWSVAPATTVSELFEIDPNTSYVKRLTDTKTAPGQTRR